MHGSWNLKSGASKGPGGTYMGFHWQMDKKFKDLSRTLQDLLEKTGTFCAKWNFQKKFKKLVRNRASPLVFETICCIEKCSKNSFFNFETMKLEYMYFTHTRIIKDLSLLICKAFPGPRMFLPIQGLSRIFKDCANPASNDHKSAQQKV